MFSKKNRWWEPGRVEQMKNSERCAVAESFPKVRRKEPPGIQAQGIRAKLMAESGEEKHKMAPSWFPRYKISQLFFSFVDWSACTYFLSKETEEQIIHNALKDIIYICSTLLFGLEK